MIKAVYIHIPFCKTICSYCDFCKMFYNEIWIKKYLKALNEEINTYYKGECIKTLYIGGGTPNSLDDNELESLFKILQNLKLDNDYEYTIECNIELLTENQIKLFKKYNINRVSIGIQTFNEKNLKFLGRNHTKSDAINKINLLKEYGINNINVDLMYALPKQTLEELKEDIDILLSLDIPHISTYSLIIEPNTILYNNRVENIDEDLDNDMYNLILKKLRDYNHYETSNFAKEGYESKHNLTYWNNEHYYGFGLGASGYIDDIRYDNTRSINKYIEKKYRLNFEHLNKNIEIENEFILGFRKINGINIEKFYSKYNIDLIDLEIIKKLLKEEKIVLDNGNIRINDKYIYLANDILIEFLGEKYEK